MRPSDEAGLTLIEMLIVLAIIGVVWLNARDVQAAINASLGDAAQNHDAVGYIRLNLEFHRTLYLRAQAPAMLAVLETIWLQLGPTMRAVYQRMRRNEPPRHHRLILAALRAGDEPGLRLAVRADVTQGLRHLMSQDAR